ncbi:MAG: dimethyl sulfoxide reductase anchor subunit [Eggerthellaceae bacterium]|nr:dimethyl sulfoxide reductase anchor subunit [Eggerthellaceae bacterium]
MISEFPLFVFTTLAGLAAGAYAVSAVFPVQGGAAGEGGGAAGASGEGARKRAWLFPLVCLVLLGLGLIGCLFHLARPAMFLNALANPTAGIAQEAYLSIVFGVLLVADLIVAWRKGAVLRPLRIVGAVAAVALVLVMGNAYLASAGVPAWTSWQTILLYLFGDLAMGAALLAAFDNALLGRSGYAVASAVLSVLAALSCALEAAHFAGVGADMVLLAAGAVIVAVGAALQFVAKSGKMPAKTAAWAAFACVFIGVAIARYGFYAACML